MRYPWLAGGQSGDRGPQVGRPGRLPQGQPAVMFFSADIKGDHERIKARGAAFSMPPTQVPGSTIAKLEDTCGNLIQITELARG